MALAALLRQGYFKHVVTTALDGLHLRAGVAPACLSELQGTIYKEMCSLCGRVYLRAYNAAAFTTSDDQFTGRVCENAQCLGTELS
jgi:NAD-dependent SIR2 family protein deacetylase